MPLHEKQPERTEEANRRALETDLGAARRIHIIGAPGSGKTTLARQWAKRIGATAYDLDEIGYEGGSGAERPDELRLADVKRIVEQPAWVTEGIYLRWTQGLFQAADVIVWLDVPWSVCAYRIVKRHVRASLARNNRHKGIRKLIRFIGWTRGYHRNSRTGEDALSHATTSECLKRYAHKLIHCRTRRDLNRLSP
jgi:adenylate kinase family enzyme